MCDDEHGKVNSELVQTLPSLASLHEVADEGQIEEGVVINHTLDEERLRHLVVLERLVCSPILPVTDDGRNPVLVMI